MISDITYRLFSIPQAMIRRKSGFLLWYIHFGFSLEEAVEQVYSRTLRS
jgi:hypothetical protein